MKKQVFQAGILGAALVIAVALGCTHLQKDARKPNNVGTDGFDLVTSHWSAQELKPQTQGPDGDPGDPAKPRKLKRLKLGLRDSNITKFYLGHTHTIALTFDDGPGDGTQGVNDLLRQYGIEAQFFSIGKNARDKHELLILDATPFKDANGSLLQNAVGNHSYVHPDLSQKQYINGPMALYDQLKYTDDVLKSILDHANIPGWQGYLNQSASHAVYFRAPFGNWNVKDGKILKAKQTEWGPAAADLNKYVGPIYWDVGGEIDCANPVAGAANSKDKCGDQALTDAADWDCWDNKMPIEQCADGYYRKLKDLDGGVVLSHDLYANTAQMWQYLMPKLVADGFHFVRLDKIPAIARYNE